MLVQVAEAMMTMDSTRLRGVLALTAAFAIAACGKDSGQDGGGEEGESSTGDSGSAATTMTTASATTENTTDPSCIPGSEDCPCLDGVECQGTLECLPACPSIRNRPETLPMTELPA